MRLCTQLFVVGILGLALVAATGLVEPPTSSSADKPAAAAGAAKFDIQAAAFLKGTWAGRDEHEGTLLEETWSAPEGRHILGMFRWMGDAGLAGMVEILTITEEDEGVVIRLRHFGAGLKPWESEKDGCPTLTLTEAGDNKLVFTSDTDKSLSRLTYDATKAGKLTITVEFPAAGNRPPLVIDLEKK